MRYFDTRFLDEADEFIASLKPKTAKKIFYNIDLAEQTNDPRLFKKLKKEIWEFRTKYEGLQIRLLAFWDKTDNKETLVMATHGFIKKVDKVPENEIEIQAKLLLEFFESRVKLATWRTLIVAKLFERNAGRYVPTVAGEELARAGADIEEAATRSLLRVAGRDLRATGLVRLTTTESIASGLLAPLAAVCREQHPGIQIQVVADNSLYDLAKRDADIAIRPTRKPPQHLIGKTVGLLAMCVYGSRRYLQRNRAKDFAAHEWIVFDDARSNSPTLEWLAAIKPLDQIAYRTNSHIGVARAWVR